MYAASQLLWNPDRDTDEILGELTEGIWGLQNGPKVLEAVKLIQDVRSGPTWDTYWWTLPDYRLGTDNPSRDLERAESAIEKLQSMKIDSQFVPKFPLPFPPTTLIEIMLPHLEQIRMFAKFRIELEVIRRAMVDGLGKEEISKRLSAAWRPIPEYTTWVGTFGQPEARMQEILVGKVATEAGVPLTEPAWVRARDAERLLEKIQNIQRAQHGELRFKPSEINEFWWNPAKLQSRLDKLVADGSVEKLGPDSYRLVNWEQFTR